MEGKKYKKCCLEEDLAAEREMRKRKPEIQAEMRKIKAKIERGPEKLRKEYGVYVNYVASIEGNGRKAWAIGTRVYPNRPPGETFHEFLLDVLRGTLGDDWRERESGKPADERHFVMRCFDEYAKFTKTMRTPENQQG